MRCLPGCQCSRHKKIANDLTGAKFGRLTALAEAPRERGNWRVRWTCQCDCGVRTTVSASHLTMGKIQSCGCLKSELDVTRNRTHGKSKTPTYKNWAEMLKRCRNPKSKNWEYYGGRGITVCDRWLSFENFLEDMGERPDGMSVERMNNSLGYSPENCKWATFLEQMNNTRKCKPVFFNGRTITISMLAREYGLNPKAVLERVRKGKTIEQALGIST